jgi:hypothetical protein
MIHPSRMTIAESAECCAFPPYPPSNDKNRPKESHRPEIHTSVIGSPFSPLPLSSGSFRRMVGAFSPALNNPAPHRQCNDVPRLIHGNSGDYKLRL